MTVKKPMARVLKPVTSVPFSCLHLNRVMSSGTVQLCTASSRILPDGNVILWSKMLIVEI